MKKFSFRHLIGLVPAPVELAAQDASQRLAAAEQEDEEEDEGGEGSAESDDEGGDDTEANDGEGDDDDEEDGEEEASAKAARKKERQRCAGIFASPAAEGRIGLACQLAFNSNLSVKSAVAIMKKAPSGAAATGSGLAAAMAKFGSPAVGADGSKKTGQVRPDARAIYERMNNPRGK